jgi:hypothetical protein
MNFNSVVSLCVIMVVCVVFSETQPPYLQPEINMESEDELESPAERTQKTEGRRGTHVSSVPEPPPPPVPIDKRGEELTFAETGHHKVFMFAKSNTFIQLDGNRIPTFQLR